MEVSTIAQVGAPVLQAVAEPVLQFDESLHSLVKRMQMIMQEANGVGIAAPQIFASLRVIIIASRPSERYPDAPLMESIVLINPELIAYSEEMVLGWEGCLSVPDLRGEVNRHQWVIAKYQDISGQQHQQKLQGFVARIFQHELDHLNGHIFLDRINDEQALMSTSEWLQQS
ncbi:MAG: peptide deformylase [Ferrimonas sp.]